MMKKMSVWIVLLLMAGKGNNHPQLIDWSWVFTTQTAVCTFNNRSVAWGKFVSKIPSDEKLRDHHFLVGLLPGDPQPQASLQALDQHLCASVPAGLGPGEDGQPRLPRQQHGVPSAVSGGAVPGAQECAADRDRPALPAAGHSQEERRPAGALRGLDEAGPC